MAKSKLKTVEEPQPAPVEEMPQEVELGCGCVVPANGSDVHFLNWQGLAIMQCTKCKLLIGFGPVPVPQPTIVTPSELN